MTTRWTSRTARRTVRIGDRRVYRFRAGAAPYVFLGDTEGGEPVVLHRGRRGFLGVHVVELTEDLRRHFGAPADEGVLVSRIVEDSPAERAGVAVGDVLVSANGGSVRNAWDLKRRIATLSGGDTVEVHVVRGGRPRELTAVLDERRAKTVDLGDFFFRGDDGEMIMVAPGHADWQRALEGLEHHLPRVRRLGPHIEVQVEDALRKAVEALEGEELDRILDRELATRQELEEKLRRMEKRLREIEQRLRGEE